jgi:undecaprenyl diphosphate synthase
MNLPQHVAIIMDGNGRWAKKRFLPRIAGHQQGAESVRAIVKSCSQKGIRFLTLFAFSSENWSRPKTEVDFLLSLFLRSLKEEMQELHRNNVRLCIIGDRSPFSQELQTAMCDAETLTADNTGLQVNLALNYGGRWDIVQAARSLAERVLQGNLKPEEISETLMQEALSLAGAPDPDLLIRTSGEQRISNFLLWYFAYTELYFIDTPWPDFREAEFEKALEVFASRQRRFGYTTEQLEGKGLHNSTVSRDAHARQGNHLTKLQSDISELDIEQYAKA